MDREIVKFVSVISFLFFLFILMIISIVPVWNYSHGQVIQRNNYWHSDGITYTNFTVFIQNTGNQYVVVKCDYYSIGSIMNFTTINQYPLFGLFKWGGTPQPDLVEGC